jgi:phage-related protein
MTWVIVVVAVVVVLALAALALGRGRSAALKRRFGPEYDRSVDEEGGRRAAEASLRDRAKRRDGLELRELPPGARAQFAAKWRDVQSGFVDDPRQAVDDADGLVQDVMRQRGYPVDEFDDRLEMVSVDHPELAENYRVAHAIQGRSGSDSTSVDDLREAFQRYRALFADLLADGTVSPREDADADEVVEDDRELADEHDVPREHDVR